MKKYLLIATALVLAAACQKEPSASDFDGEYLVYTAHSEDVSDFSGYETFTVADSLLAIDGDNGSMFLNDWGKTVRNQYIDRMEELGYTYVDTGKLDSDLDQEVQRIGGAHIPGTGIQDIGEAGGTGAIHSL